MKNQILRFAATLLFFICSSQWALAQVPGNDNCSGVTPATILTSGTATAGSVWNATASVNTISGTVIGNPDDDVWYTFTTPAPAGTKSATIELTTVGTDLAATGVMIQLFSGTCAGTLTSIASANGDAGPIVVNNLTNNTIYFVRVYSYATGALASQTGSAFTIKYTSSITPSNDECTGAILLPTSSSRLPSQGWLAGATTTTGIATCGAGPWNYDVWYKFVAEKATDTIVLAKGVSGNLPDNVMIQLFNGTCGSLTSRQCSATPLVATGLTVGTTYYLRVYTTSGTAITTGTANRYFDITSTYAVNTSPVTDSTSTLFNTELVAKNLGFPWEITYGPDDSLWITEAKGYRVVRISPTRTAANINLPPQQVLKLPLGSNGTNGPTFDRTIGTWPQGGMEGLAIHPEFKTGGFAKQLVYIAYVYSGACALTGWPPPSNTPCVFRSKIVQCQFYKSTDPGNPSTLPKKDTLVIIDTLISNLPGSNDHNSGRLVFGPTPEGPDNKYRLYYTIGDMGAGQFNNDLRTNNAQNKDTCEGKILRLNSEKDADGVPGSPIHDYDRWRQWIPNDNPFTHSINGLRTPIYTYGHRNAQGLAWGNVGGTWRLYSSEHGDQSGDEVNILQSGKNYGWPKVTGVADNNYSTYDNLTNDFTQNDILAHNAVSDEETFAKNTTNFTKPIFDFFNWSPAQIQAMDVNNIFTWSTIAPSSIGFYDGNIPGWNNSLLVTSLKYGMFRLKLKSNGTEIDSLASTNGVDTFPLLHSWRIRDIAINPVKNSGQFWAITDSSGSTSGPTGGFSGFNQETKDGGRVIKLTYKTLITLPINYVTFTGKLLTDKTIQLYWKAETDDNHSYFEVEKSASNGSFVNIGNVTGVFPGYQLIDPMPFVGNNYYRIKEVGKNGKISYSKVINVVYDPSAYLITYYPNPVKDVLNIKIASPKYDHLQVQITDMQGRLVYNQTKTITSGLNEIKVDTKTWASQLYSVKIIGNDNQILAADKFIKQ